MPEAPTGHAVEHAYRIIRDGIVRGTYKSGQHLKGADLAAAIGVSRTPVREALRRLHSEGAVNFVANHGAYVTGWTRADLNEVFGLRLVLESYAAELAATALTEKQIDEIATLAEETHHLATTQPANFHDRIATANNRLHRLIIAAAANRRLATLIASVIDLPLVMRTFHHYSNDHLLRSANHHRELAAAFRARDPAWAASVMRSHILAAHHVLLDLEKSPQKNE